MGYIKVPTGWGKTFLAKHLMKQYCEEGKTVLFLVSRNNPLLTQTFSGDDGLPLFPNSIILSSDYDEVSIDHLQDIIKNRGSGSIIFASLQTILSKNNIETKDILSQNSDLVIIDEVHNFIDNRGNNFINDLNQNAKIFGMTATPFQGVIGNVKFVDDISGETREIFSKTLPQCIIDNDLCELNYRIIRSNQDIMNLFDFEEKGLLALDKEELFLNCSTLENIDLVAQRTYLAKKVYDDKIKNTHSKTLIFCAPVRNIIHGFGEDEKRINAFHSKLCSAVFNNELKDKFDPTISFNNYANHGQFKNAVYLSSELPKKSRDEILQAFRTIDKPPFILCTVGMLIEGFDFPDLENLILLRPTLSMRLFEQQVGRITRLPHKSNKDQGNIFEIVDDIDSLYDKFGEHLFEENKIERIQMLQPEHRIEELFTEGNTLEAIQTGKIEISEVSFGKIVSEFQENPVQIPPISLRATDFGKLLSMVEQITEGSRDGRLRRPLLELMQMAIRFKIHSIDDAKEISKLIELLDKLEQQAKEDPQLSDDCRKEKPIVLNEVKWLLKLTALTSLKYSSQDLALEEKNNILHILGFEGGYNEIDNYRKECLKHGMVANIEGLSTSIREMNDLVRRRVEVKFTKYLSRLKVYWASCFIEDDPELKELFQSGEWDYNVKRYIIKGR